VHDAAAAPKKRRAGSPQPKNLLVKEIPHYLLSPLRQHRAKVSMDKVREESVKRLEAPRKFHLTLG
jgi:hypothetical protein